MSWFDFVGLILVRMSDYHPASTTFRWHTSTLKKAQEVMADGKKLEEDGESGKLNARCALS
jgi:hypothetical protein